MQTDARCFSTRARSNHKEGKFQMAMNDSTSIQLPLPFDNTFTIPLTQGQVTIVDAIDADLA